MNAQREIFKEFFKRLDEDEKFPAQISNALKILSEQSPSISKTDILEAIRNGCDDVNKDKENSY